MTVVSLSSASVYCMIRKRLLGGVLIMQSRSDSGVKGLMLVLCLNGLSSWYQTSQLSFASS